MCIMKMVLSLSFSLTNYMRICGLTLWRIGKSLDDEKGHGRAANDKSDRMYGHDSNGMVGVAYVSLPPDRL